MSILKAFLTPYRARAADIEQVLSPSSHYPGMAFPDYIVIEGPPGVGKTAVATRLADHLHLPKLLDLPLENAFLPYFSVDPRRYGFCTQLAFLMNRLKQLEAHAEKGFFHEPLVSDFLFERSLLYAGLILSVEEQQLYHQLSQRLLTRVQQPDLVIYLQASVRWLLSDARQAFIPASRTLPEGYLRRLTEAYSRFFLHYDHSKLLVIDIEEFFCAGEDFPLLLEQIEKLKGKRLFFSKRL